MEVEDELKVNKCIDRLTSEFYLPNLFALSPSLSQQKETRFIKGFAEEYLEWKREKQSFYGFGHRWMVSEQSSA